MACFRCKLNCSNKGVCTITSYSSLPKKESHYFLLAFLLSIILMLADHYGRYTDTLRSAIITLIHPLEQIASYPHRFSLWLQKERSTLDTLALENQKLRTENLLLKSRILSLSHYQQEAKRLEKLLGTSASLTNHKIQIANVIFYSHLPLSQFLEIDKGKYDGIQPHQAVIDAYGIMGQTITITPWSSRVLLITDPDHQIPVRIRRTGQRGMLTGIGHDKVRLDFIPSSSSVKAGDLIETSGLGKVFPAGYPVAEVTSVKTLIESPYLEVLADPTAKISLSYKVLVLSKTNPITAK